MQVFHSDEIESNETSPARIDIANTAAKVKTVQQLSSDTTNESPSAKSARPNFNFARISVETRQSPRLINLQRSDLSAQPSSAVLLTTPKRIRNKEKNQQDYSVYYDNAELFLDEKVFVIVEPGAETKFKKHIKVFTRSQSLDQELISSPLYSGSPALTQVGDSSLLARRANSKNLSPLLKKSDEEQTDTHPKIVLKKVSRFAENAARRIELTNESEEEKTPLKLKLFSQAKMSDESPQRDRARVRTIQETSNETTPMNGSLKHFSSNNLSPIKLME